METQADYGMYTSGVITTLMAKHAKDALAATDLVIRHGKNLWRMFREGVTAQYAAAELAVADSKALAAKRIKNANRRMKDDAMRSLGLTKVRGAVSGRTYWE